MPSLSFEKTRGQRPNDLRQRLDFNSALQRVASGDATVHQIMGEVTHLVKPSSALHDPQIVEHATALDECLRLTSRFPIFGAGRA